MLRERHRENEPKKPTRYFSSKQEKQVAKELGGKTTSNSGATMFGGKGDVLLDEFSLEMKTKTTHSESISIKKEWLEKNKQAALFDGKKYDALCFSFGPDEDNYFIIDQYLFQELVEYLTEKEKK